MRSFARRHPRWTGALLIPVLLLTIWGSKLWQLQASVDAYASAWEQPRGEPGGLVYVALGDSAAQGIGASSLQRGYVSLVADRLAASTGRPVQVINLSSSGARIRDVIEEQLPELAGLRRPDLITVDVGGNDLRRYDAATYREDVAALVAGLPKGTVLADIPYFMHGRAQRDADEAAAFITERATQGGLVVAPLQETMRARGWQGMFTDYAADWFHPNNRGHRVWADSFWQVIAPLPVARAS